MMVIVALGNNKQTMQKVHEKTIKNPLSDQKKLKIDI
jgi:hypothetical protein